LQILTHRWLEIILEEQSRKGKLSQKREEVAAKLKILATERQLMVLEWRADEAEEDRDAERRQYQ
jgi:hypothetical protein